MKTRFETIVTIDISWRAGKDENELIDIILPKEATDYMVTEYDGSETLYIVKNNKLYVYDINKKDFIQCGERKETLTTKIIKNSIINV